MMSDSSAAVSGRGETRVARQLIPRMEPADIADLGLHQQGDVVADSGDVARARGRWASIGGMHSGICLSTGRQDAELHEWHVKDGVPLDPHIIEYNENDVKVSPNTCECLEAVYTVDLLGGIHT